MNDGTNAEQWWQTDTARTVRAIVIVANFGFAILATLLALFVWLVTRGF
jgi:hypothetical protein